MMLPKKALVVLMSIVAVCSVAAYLYMQHATAPREDMRPQFANYPAGTVYRERPAVVDFSSWPAAEQFRTRIEAGASEGANFAGHYTVVTWGCGTSCQNSAIIDTTTGRIVVYGIISSFGLGFRPESRLLITNPAENLPESQRSEMKERNGEQYPLGSIPAVSHYYVLEDDALTFIGRFGIASGEEHLCDAEVSSARNPFTQEIVEYPTPCHVPFGWSIVASGQPTNE
jgi:hypothetical protein